MMVAAGFFFGGGGGRYSGVAVVKNGTNHYQCEVARIFGYQGYGLFLAYSSHDTMNVQ